MNIVRWDPFRELQEMGDRLNRVFGSTATGGQSITSARRGMMASADWSPVVDIAESPEEYLIKAEIPEVRKEDVHVTIEDGVLRVAGERRHESEERGTKFHRVERRYGSFARSFSLPENADESKVKADFKDGLLCVHLPKGEPPRKRSIDVEVT